MRTIITTTTINRVVTGIAGRVVVVTDGDKRTHYSAAPRSSRVLASRHASYRASVAHGQGSLLRAVGTASLAVKTVAAMLQDMATVARGWFQEPAKRLLPVQAKMVLCAARRPATGLPRLRG